MAKDIEAWRPPRMTSSLAQRSESSRNAIAHATSHTEAAKAAKVLIGSYAFIKTHDPDAFNASIAAVLSQYPLGLVQECVDPRVGAARAIKFLSVADLVAWLDHRLEFHQVLARHVPRAQLPGPAPREYSEQHRAGMLARFGQLLAKLMRAPDPITQLRREARRKADAQLIADRARALADLQAAVE